jgi:16S rRNA (cytosine967-C5)-methyltransferase
VSNEKETKKPYGERKQFNSKKPYVKKDFSDKKELGERKQFDSKKPYVKKDFNERTPFKERPPFVKKDYTERPAYEGRKEFKPRQENVEEKKTIREIAYNALVEIIINEKFQNIVQNQYIKDNRLFDRDKSFFVNLIHGTVKNYLSLKEEINKISNHQIKPKMMVLLAMSYYQLRYLDRTPSYAIINDAVNIAKTIDSSRGGGFANAVLKKLALLPKASLEEENKIQQEAFPKFLIKLLEAQYGEEITEKLIKTFNKEARLCVRVNTDKISVAELLTTGHYTQGVLAPTALYYTGEDAINELIEFKQGKIVVQDETGQLIAPLLMPTKTDKILDMCAAPGSKLSHICSILKNKGDVLATDIHESRIKLIEKTLRLQDYRNVSLLTTDATLLKESYKDTFDKILLDAPCSGLGVLQRKNDITLKITDSTIDTCITIQGDLLNTAGVILKRGGTLVYSTCTLNKNENENQIKAFLNRFRDFELIEQKTILPFEYNTDGFFYAVLKRI